MNCAPIATLRYFRKFIVRLRDVIDVVFCQFSLLNLIIIWHICEFAIFCCLYYVCRHYEYRVTFNLTYMVDTDVDLFSSILLVSRTKSL